MLTHPEPSTYSLGLYQWNGASLSTLQMLSQILGSWWRLLFRLRSGWYILLEAASITPCQTNVPLSPRFWCPCWPDWVVSLGTAGWDTSDVAELGCRCSVSLVFSVLAVSLIYKRSQLSSPAPHHSLYDRLQHFTSSFLDGSLEAQRMCIRVFLGYY